MTKYKNNLGSYLESLYTPEQLQQSVRKQRETGTYDPTMANTLNLARDQWNYGHMLPSKNASQLSYPELTTEAQKLLVRDRSRLAGSNYPAYTGKTTAPMSTLTQRQRELQEQFRNKPAPYSGKLQNILSRDVQGFSPEQIQNMIEMQRTGQTNANKNIALDYMRKQFGERYGNREARLEHKLAKDLGRVNNASQQRLEHLGEATKEQEGRYNRGLGNVFYSLQGNKEHRRENLTNLLGELGNQKHTYGNIANDINKAEFEREVNEPYRKMELLNNLIQGQTYTGGVDPGVEAAQHKAMQQGLKAYGVDTSKPAGDWGKDRIESPKYKGQLVADLNPELLASYNLAQHIDPKWQEPTYDQRKKLEKEAIGKAPIGTRMVSKLPETLKPHEQNLDWATKDMIKRQLGLIAQQHIGRGTYGSGVHLHEAESKQRELMKAAHGERENLMHGVLNRDMTSVQNQDLNELHRLYQLGQIGEDEFNDIIRKNKELNKLGATKWGNQQNQLNNEYQNFQNESSYEWPHIKQAAISGMGKGANNALSALQQKYDLNLDSLKGQNTAHYSELEKENQSLQDKLEGIFNKNTYFKKQQEELNRYNQLAKDNEEARKQKIINEENKKKTQLSQEGTEKQQRNSNLQKGLQDLLNRTAPNMPPPGAFYSPENANWYTKPLTYNNEYVNEPWKNSNNYYHGGNQIGKYIEGTTSHRFPHSGSASYGNIFPQQSYPEIYEYAKNYRYS